MRSFIGPLCRRVFSTWLFVGAIVSISVLLPTTQVNAQPVPAPNSVIEEQLAALRWLFDTYDGPNWRGDAQASWRQLATATAATFLGSACARGEGEFVVGVTCGSARISKIYLREVGLKGPASALTYDRFFSKFPQTVFDFTLNHLEGQLADDYDVESATVFGLLVGGNRLTGAIPATLFTKHIVTIDLSKNSGLSSTLPDNMDRAVRLRSLYLSKVDQDSVSHALPDAICNMPVLEILDISSNRFYSLPDCFSNLAGTMKRLSINNNILAGSIPSYLCDFSLLEAINLSGNSFDGTFPECFSRLSHLQHLDVIGTRITGAFPQFVMTAYPNLRILHLSSFTGPVPDQFDTAHMPHLERLQLGGPIHITQNPDETLTGGFPFSVFGALNLTSLVIQNTLFEGTITSDHFKRLRRICEVKFMENWVLRGEFPTSLLTDVWTTPIDLKTEQFPRLLVLNTNPYFSGCLPDLSPSQIANLHDLNTEDAEGFQFRNCDFYGWIPDSMAQWVPPASQHDLLLNNPKLFYPVQPAMVPWTSNNSGFPTSVGKFEPWSIPFVGGYDVVLNGAFPFSSKYKVAFFHPEENPTSLMKYKNATSLQQLWSQRLFTVDAHLLYSEPVTYAPTETFIYYGQKEETNGPVPTQQASTGNSGRRQEAPRAAELRPDYYSQLAFTTPDVGKQIRAMPAMVFIEGAVRNSNTDDLILVAQQGAILSFYNPKPTVTGVSRTDIRREGCARLTLIGQGFSNAPSPLVHMLWDAANPSGPVLTMADAEVISDTEIAFTLPFANPDNFTHTFESMTGGVWNRPYPLVVYPAGLSKPNERSDPSEGAFVRFVETCPGAIVPCKAGHEDEYGCPVAAMCACNSRGSCLTAGGGQPVCSCDNFFNGSSCRSCTAGRYGSECAACECGHGTCALNSQDGACTCDAGWMGSKCNINQLALTIGVAVSAGLLLLILICVMIRCIIVRNRKRAEENKKASESMELPAESPCNAAGNTMTTQSAHATRTAPPAARPARNEPLQ